MKDMPIGKLLNDVKTGAAQIRYEVDLGYAIYRTFNQSSIVHITEACGAVPHTEIDHQVLADAIRERCAG